MDLSTVYFFLPSGAWNVEQCGQFWCVKCSDATQAQPRRLHQSFAGEDSLWTDRLHHQQSHRHTRPRWELPAIWLGGRCLPDTYQLTETRQGFQREEEKESQKTASVRQDLLFVLGKHVKLSQEDTYKVTLMHHVSSKLFVSLPFCPLTVNIGMLL